MFATLRVMRAVIACVNYFNGPCYYTYSDYAAKRIYSILLKSHAMCFVKTHIKPISCLILRIAARHTNISTLYNRTLQCRDASICPICDFFKVHISTRCLILNNCETFKF